jgi:hypothetical protein
LLEPLMIRTARSNSIPAALMPTGYVARYGMREEMWTERWLITTVPSN